MFESLFSSWAELHAAEMGVALGLLGGLIVLHGRRAIGIGVISFTAGILIGFNLNVSPWEGWWHVWYILLPFTAISFLLSLVGRRALNLQNENHP